jgi:hypothetical protein
MLEYKGFQKTFTRLFGLGESFYGGLLVHQPRMFEKKTHVTKFQLIWTFNSNLNN